MDHSIHYKSGYKRITQCQGITFYLMRLLHYLADMPYVLFQSSYICRSLSETLARMLQRALMKSSMAMGRTCVWEPGAGSQWILGYDWQNTTTQGWWKIRRYNLLWWNKNDYRTLRTLIPIQFMNNFYFAYNICVCPYESTRPKYQLNVLI